MEVITSNSSIYAMDHSKFIVSNQNEESISISMVYVRSGSCCPLRFSNHLQRERERERERLLL